MHENLHELSYLTDVEWKTIYFFYRVVYTDRWIGEGRHDLLTGDQLVFYDAGESCGVCDGGALGVGHILSRGGECTVRFGVSVGPYSAVGRELALGVCLGEGLIIGAGAHIAIVYIPRKADYS